MSTSRVNTAKWDEKKSLWRIIVTRDGKRKEFTSAKPGRTGQREANKKADAWISGTAPVKRLKVSQAYELYMENEKGRHSTDNWNDILSKGRNWIIPYIGNRYLDSLTLGDIQAILDDADRKGRSKKMQQNIRGRLSSFLRFCRRNNWTQLRTDDLMVNAHAHSGTRRILQADELQILFTSSTTVWYGKEIHDPFINAYRLQVLCGLRPGELLGLRWEDITEQTISVSRSINVHGEETTGKNENAIRTIAVSGMMQQILHDQRLQTGTTPYVFPPVSEKQYRIRWQRYCETNGIPHMTAYELRHTFVSITASVLPEGAIKSIVGHSRNMDTFGVYAHDVNGDQARNAELLDERFSKLISG